jgi:hypothetical protein
MSPPGHPEVDPFDLPDWLGDGDVIWSPEAGIHDRHLVAGVLTGRDDQSMRCALMAVDEAYPKPVADDELRHQAHQAWRHGQVYLLSYDDGLTLAVPGISFTAERVMEAIARLAKAVGARPESFSVLLRLGG